VLIEGKEDGDGTTWLGPVADGQCRTTNAT
jgi:hypothetical protein